MKYLILIVFINFLERLKSDELSSKYQHCEPTWAYQKDSFRSVWLLLARTKAPFLLGKIGPSTLISCRSRILARQLKTPFLNHFLTSSLNGLVFFSNTYGALSLDNQCHLPLAASSSCRLRLASSQAASFSLDLRLCLLVYWIPAGVLLMGIQKAKRFF